MATHVGKPCHELDPFLALVSERLTDGRAGVTSVCTAHPIVIEAALSLGASHGQARPHRGDLQSGQPGGRLHRHDAGRFPRDSSRPLRRASVFDPSRIILGGDHLGPNPWKHLPADEAMQRAKTMIDAYARAGFAKLHLDTSMGCAGEPAALARRSDRWARRRLGQSRGRRRGKRASLRFTSSAPKSPCREARSTRWTALEVTRPEAALRTVEVHQKAFSDAGLEAAFARAIGVVVQAGRRVRQRRSHSLQAREGGAPHGSVGEAAGLCLRSALDGLSAGGLLSTLWCRDGFAILKVGPWLTFALREALYGLDCIARVSRSCAERMTVSRRRWKP